ncbi:phosphohydrolase [Klebsiella phage vB_KpM_Centimanus]
MNSEFSNFWETYSLVEFDPIWGRQFFNRYNGMMQWVDKHNIGRPYHSTRHLIGVGVLTGYLLKSAVHSQYWISEEDIEAAVVAGFLHDFCHQGEKDDWKNIGHALEQIERLGFWQAFPKVNKTLVTLLIGFTHYDFGDPFPQYPGGTTMRYLFGIIRDADQLYAMSYLDEDIFNGLYQEIGVRFGQTREEFTKRNIDYIANLKFYTLRGATHAKKYQVIAQDNCQYFGLTAQGNNNEAVSGE